MKCLSCGRKLKNPESVKMGYGPVCHERVFGRTAGKRVAGAVQNIPYYDIPGQMTLDEYMQTLC